MVSRMFKKASDGSKVDLVNYTRQILSEHPECEIYVGCDSQNVDKQTVYATAVVFRYGRNGAHVIYFKDGVKRIKDLRIKLMGEVERSINVSEFLKNEAGITIFRIDLDYNKDPKHRSNIVLKDAVGYVEGMGYKCASKPDMLISIRVANKLCRKAVGKGEGVNALIEN
jgi:hypothetical protein